MFKFIDKLLQLKPTRTTALITYLACMGFWALNCSCNDGGNPVTTGDDSVDDCLKKAYVLNQDQPVGSMMEQCKADFSDISKNHPEVGICQNDQIDLSLTIMQLAAACGLDTTGTGAEQVKKALEMIVLGTASIAMIAVETGLTAAQVTQLLPEHLRSFAGLNNNDSINAMQAAFETAEHDAKIAKANEMITTGTSSINAIAAETGLSATEIRALLPENLRNFAGLNNTDTINAIKAAFEATQTGPNCALHEQPTADGKGCMSRQCEPDQALFVGFGCRSLTGNDPTCHPVNEQISPDGKSCTTRVCEQGFEFIFNMGCISTNCGTNLVWTPGVGCVFQDKPGDAERRDVCLTNVENKTLDQIHNDCPVIITNEHMFDKFPLFKDACFDWHILSHLTISQNIASCDSMRINYGVVRCITDNHDRPISYLTSHCNATTADLVRTYERIERTCLSKGKQLNLSWTLEQNASFCAEEFHNCINDPSVTVREMLSRCGAGTTIDTILARIPSLQTCSINGKEINLDATVRDNIRECEGLFNNFRSLQLCIPSTEGIYFWFGGFAEDFEITKSSCLSQGSDVVSDASSVEIYCNFWGVIPPFRAYEGDVCNVEGLIGSFATRQQLERFGQLQPQSSPAPLQKNQWAPAKNQRNNYNQPAPQMLHKQQHKNNRRGR
ncbi:MAG: hypothetical protein FWD33_03765 [Alphaproteobacteria bacterium]|nr:hypothetical protein [Alphaproteobacteria bacterium]